jgi:serine/threonine protein phosphatase 1
MRNQPDHMLRWERCDESRPHMSGKMIVCGHTPQKSRRPLVRDHLICIDTAAFHDGFLTALDVTSDTVWQAPAEGPVEVCPLSDFPRRR